MFNDILDIISAFDPLLRQTPNKTFQQAYCPAIKEVIDNRPTTIVKFADGSKAVVKCSQNDDYNLETAIIYAIVKRTYCSSIDKSGEAFCPGLGNSLKRIMDKVNVAKTSANYLSEAPAKQLDQDVPSCPNFKPRKTSKIAAVLNNDPCSGTPSCGAYCQKKPAKKSLKCMTQEEKRAYWREQKRKQRERQQRYAY